MRNKGAMELTFSVLVEIILGLALLVMGIIFLVKSFS